MTPKKRQPRPLTVCEAIDGWVIKVTKRDGSTSVSSDTFYRTQAAAISRMDEDHPRIRWDRDPDSRAKVVRARLILETE